MGNLRFRLQMMFMALVLGLATASAQNIRYVSYQATDNSKDGTSWANAKKDIQDAINDLVNNNITGEVWVQGALDGSAKYYPTESTEASTTLYYKSFKIPAGITVRGGFAGTEATAADRVTIDDKNFGNGTEGGEAKEGKLDNEDAKSGVYKYKTILSGDITNKKASFTWNSTKEQFDVTFYGNSFHVVWFAMNGFNASGRANPLTKPAKLEGCVVEGGHAYTRDAINPGVHEGYGGGIYMVANSFVYNCEVRNCDASRDGGGIYMDGGGIVRRTLVHNCQALGVGTEFGLGGGICEDGAPHNSKTNPIVVAQSVVTNCVGRMGGGMALKADKISNRDHKYAVVANSTLVNNNTAQVEAGGVYTYKGGGLASLTVVRNKCNGSGITQNGQLTGRSGGVYSRDPSYIGNCVMWGNTCRSNRDIQYADSHSSLQDKEKTHFYYNALSKAEIVDWSKTNKMNVLSLDDENSTEISAKGSKGYPLFEKPTTEAGYIANYFTADPAYDWKVFSESALHHAGINTADLDYEGLTPAPQGDAYDMQFGKFNSRCTLGAIISEEPNIDSNNDIVGEAHFYVDPNYNFATHHQQSEAKGTSWDLPTRFLGNVLEYINADRKKDPASQEYKDRQIFIHVKEGVVDNTDSYKGGHVRCTSLDIPSNVTLLGSYDAHLVGTDLSLRNVVHTPTVISAQLMNSYDYNIAHLININKQHDILIEGFKISFANASSNKLGNTNADGAAITVVNSTDIKFRNVIVSNCTANRGAAVYADKSNVQFENCIFHNNETKNIDASGVIYATNNSAIDFDHCDVIRNVGYASYLGTSTTNHWQNSIFYGNMDREADDTNTDARGGAEHLPSFAGNYTGATGHHCMFDDASAKFAMQFGGNDTGNQWQYNLQYTFADGTGQGYPRFINPTKNAGVTRDGDLTYYGRATSFEPHNNNPVVNMASHADIHTSWGKDIIDVTRDYGGLPDIGAVENHMASQFEEGENAYADGQKPYGEAYYVRDYSENGTNLPTYSLNGAGQYVEDPAAKGIYNAAGELLDGSSWEYAVNGNALYTIKEAELKDENSVFVTKSTGEDPNRYTGKFRIKTGTNTYIYVDGTGLKTTTDKTKAAIVTVSGSTTPGGVPTVNAGNNRTITTVVGGTTYYLYRNGNNASVQTGSANVNIASVAGGLSINANSRNYILSNGTVTTPRTGAATVWTFEPEHALIYAESPVKQDGVTPITGEATGSVAASATVNDPLNFHVYKSIEDYNNSTTKRTYKIRRYASALYLKNNTGTNAAYLYPNATGDDFILIQDGVYGKYYLYDVTTSKYVYYYTGTSTTSRVRMDASTKSTWWIDKSAINGALNIVYGEQAWTTTGAYAITCTTNTGTRANLAAKTNDNALFVLIANAAYDVYNYQVEAKPAETINGLQYAVNSANEKFALDNKARQVSVGKGIYTNRTAADGNNTVQQPYAYMMKEGVNVYGGFPENGNPGMNERQPKTFVTVLQPQEGNPFITMTHGIYSGTGQSAKYAYVPTNWGANAGATDGSEQASVGRVLVQPVDFTVETAWDGFTLQHGYLLTARMHNIGKAIQNLNTTNLKTAGGAGALLQNKGILTNCEVKDNLLLCYPNSSTMTKTGEHTTTKTGDLYTYLLGGAGVFMTGANSVVENSQIYNNQVLTKAYIRSNNIPDNLWLLGGGLYQDNGKVYNTIIHDNVAATIKGSGYSSSASGDAANNEMVLGAGAFIASGNFYNNTIVNNQSATIYHCHANHCTFAGIHVKNDARIYNSIIADNTSHWGYEAYYSDPNDERNPGKGVPVSAFTDTGSDRSSRDNTKVHVKYSFVDVNRGTAGVDLVSRNDMVGGADPAPYNTNVYLNYAQGGTSKTITSANVYSKTGDAKTKYHIFVDSPAFNSGTEAIAGVDIPDYDAEYTDRVKDCAIDMGAYEFNGAESVIPMTTGTGVGTKQAVFYVTHNGFGDRSAKDPANAACAAKLQIVLDAAGRYKYLNPDKQVIVKVANDKAMQEAQSDFTYYATRTTDQTDQDVRVWSIMVPRGVEVWGGYTDVPMKKENGKVVKDAGKTWSNTYNGFYSGSTDLRDITGNPTYFDSYYENKLEHTGANTYHVVTFTDRIFDKNGLAYTKDDFKDKTAGQVRDILTAGTPSTYIELPGSNESIFAHMSENLTGYTGITTNTFEVSSGKYASNRAVIDGIFVSGGQADASSNSNNSTVNINSYGGAALVNDFAYVRNCILTGNTANNGGALALTHKALVSGCLIVDNEAHNNGGGIYVFEDGTKLSNGTTVNTTAGIGEQMDINMPHVFTSTIVDNKAQQGGGIWFTENINSNARFNSVAVWQNTAADQDNVYGMVNPEQPTEDETLSEIFYPFSYSLIQNIRASGTNNLSAMSYNREGVRFVNKNHDIGTNNVDQQNIAEEKPGDDKFADFGYYGLTTYSMLCSNGMPNEFYNQLRQRIAISENDFMGQPRVDNINNFVEIGARVLPKRMPNKQLMLRLFVAHPDVVDTETATRFMRLQGNTGTAEGYYSQMGSSFAYPFNFLQDALDYITRARNGQIAGLKLNDGTIIDGTVPANKDIVRNLPFEIVLGSGTYYPRQSLNGATESVWAHTFAIPEGVTIIGGFNPQGGAGTYYGRYYQKGTIGSETYGDIYTYVTPIPNTIIPPGGTEIGRGNKFGSEQVTLPAVSAVNGEHAALDAKTITFQQWHIQDIADRRGMADNNKNGIIEPWEFTNQTIISGNAVNGETDGVYHIMTAVADADAVGLMPKAKTTYNIENEAKGKTFVGESNISQETGYQWHEQGQQIRLNGLIVTGGNALTYLSTALDDYGSYMFYHGAGLLVDGNRYKNPDTTGDTSAPAFHNSAAYGLGYRDIPVSVTNCQFRNNIAGYGGAISSNGSLSLFASSFEQNMAIGQTETPADGEHWYTKINGSPQEVTEVSYPGHGGAIHVTNQLSAFNTLFANNEACLAEDEPESMVTIDLVQHPTFRVPVKANASATLRAAGGAIMMGSAANHHIVNCNFVRNKANAYPAVFTMNPTNRQNDAVNTHDYSQIINTVAWGNEVNPDMLAEYHDNDEYQTASKLMVNIGKKTRTTPYIETKGAGGFYSPAFTEGLVPTAAELSNNNAEANTDWQEASWFCAYEDGVGFKPNNTNDLRESITYSAGRFAPTMIKEANGSVYQNCNLLIHKNNGDVAGPNFGNPSVKAGFDGFMEGADWSPARFNRLTDNGNGWIKQTVDPATLAVTFNNNEALGTGYQGAYSYTHYISDILGSTVFPEYKLWLAIGNEKYMQATSDQEPQELFINGTSIGRPQKNLPRISPDPSLGVTKAYIDIGVYEYVKQPILMPNGEVDILWVSTQEHPENGPANGLTWRTPTSDLQKAIETLLSSRNGHKKEIRIMEGEYMPVTPQMVKLDPSDENPTKLNAFVIDTKKMNASAITPSGFTDGTNNDQYYAQSITIKGGYSSEIPYDYDPVKYKTVIRQAESLEGSNTDYLIYIADPTLRYAGTDSKITNDNAIFEQTGDHESNHVMTMPIQIDGVTLINNKATANKQGSAIYYPDYADAVLPAETVTKAHSVTVGTEVTYYTTDSEGVKHKSDVETEDLTTKIYYTDGTRAVRSTDNLPTEWFNESGETKMNPAKILITKTEVIGSGKSGDNNSGSAVYIGQNGGSALIYNTVFHSNNGMPLNAYNTVNVNNTFAKNAGKVQLQDASGVTVKSQMHNSVMWENNGGTGNDQFSIPRVSVDGSGDVTITGSEPVNFTYNSFTGGNTTATDYTAGKIVANNYNTGLISTNADIVNGPNFVDPLNANIESRNFDIKPSVRLLNKGNDASITSGTGKYYKIVVENKYDYSLASTTDKEVLYRNRLSSTSIDVGAYEFQGSLWKVLYVDPNKSHDDKATGENWDEAFGYGDLQNALDLAAVYHMNNPSEPSYVFAKGNSATSKDRNTNETLTIRDGVTVYGSIISNYNDWHDIKDPENPTLPKYRKSDGHEGWVYDIDAFIKDMTNQREGVASNAASKTIVNGIKTSSFTSFDGNVDGSGVSTTPALIDGFMISNKGNKVTEPVLDVTNESKNAVIVLRNILVADNDVTAATATDVNVAQINNGLIYEALFRDNTPKRNGAVLKVGTKHIDAVSPNPAYDINGYAVNVTVEGKTVGANGTGPVDGSEETNAHIYYSITNSITGTGMAGTHTAGGNGSYGSIGNKHISGYFYNIYDANLNYQLTETSKYIDMCETTNPMEGVDNTLAKFINYTTDRDLLGNPRLLTGVTSTDAAKIDRGAFETWKVQNTLNGFTCGDDGTIASSAYISIYGDTEHDLIKKHFYPHDGSVCYIMENQSLVIDAFNPEHEVKPTPENPGYLLLKEGANFYGNGRPATCAYVAIERNVPANGAVVNVPYAMKYKTNVAKSGTATEDGKTVLILTKDAPQEARYYDGSKRSDWKHIFQKTYNSEDASNCWIAMPNDAYVMAANNGVFYKPNESNGVGIYRFTGKGDALNDYIYTESLDPYKAVTLTKNDDSESTGHGADFTDEKDMGWNCVGLPYLVSSYKTYEQVTDAMTRQHYGLDNVTVPTVDPALEGDAKAAAEAAKAEAEAKNVELAAARAALIGQFMMHIPHTMWLYYNGTKCADGTTNVNGDGGYYSVNSWDNTNALWHVSSDAERTIWVGEGIFMQTATLDASESLKFYRPIAPSVFTAAALGGAKRYYFDGEFAAPDAVEVAPSEEGVVLVATEYFTADGMHLNTNGKPLDFNRLPVIPRGSVIIMRQHYSNGATTVKKFCF